MTLVFIISAPSGSGKSTLVTAIRRLVDRLDFSVSYTTRPPRGSEEEGRDYYYTSRQVFEQMIERGEFLEHADVFGDYYGTARKSAGCDQHLYFAAKQAGTGKAVAAAQLSGTDDRRGQTPAPTGHCPPGD